MKIKLLHILIFFIFPFLLFGQEIPEGKYVCSSGFTHEEFNFKSNFNFEYVYSSCTGGKTGIGTYKIDRSQLLLSFANPKVNSSSKTNSIKRQLTEKDTTNLHLTFLDSNDLTKIPGVIISYKRKSNGEICGTSSNFEGNASLKVENNELPVELEVRFIGAKTKNLKIDKNGDYIIEYILNFEFLEQFVEGETLKFRVDEFDDEKLVLKGKNRKKYETFYKTETK
jgi:hypothetical protein